MPLPHRIDAKFVQIAGVTEFDNGYVYALDEDGNAWVQGPDPKTPWRPVSSEREPPTAK